MAKPKCLECGKPLIPGCPFCRCGWPFPTEKKRGA